MAPIYGPDRSDMCFNQGPEQEMMDPFEGLSSGDRQIVTMIATAIANGRLLPHNRHSPLAARRVFEVLKATCILDCEALV